MPNWPSTSWFTKHGTDIVKPGCSLDKRINGRYQGNIPKNLCQDIVEGCTVTYSC